MKSAATFLSLTTALSSHAHTHTVQHSLRKTRYADGVMVTFTATPLSYPATTISRSTVSTAFFVFFRAPVCSALLTDCRTKSNPSPRWNLLQPKRLLRTYSREPLPRHLSFSEAPVSFCCCRKPLGRVTEARGPGAGRVASRSEHVLPRLRYRLRLR